MESEDDEVSTVVDFFEANIGLYLEISSKYNIGDTALCELLLKLYRIK